MNILEYEMAEHFVQQLYYTILKREPDAEGLKWHSQRLVKMGSLGYSILVGDFLNSEEYKHVITKKYLQQTGDIHSIFQYIQNDNKNKIAIKHIISIGDHCLTSFLLKKYGLKRYSLPFDWIFSNLETVLHCIENDFEIFLDEQYYRVGVNPVGHTATQHLFYEEKFNVDQFMFNHMDVTQTENREYLMRTVERFKQVLKSKETKVFLHIAKPDKDVTQQFEQCIACLNQVTDNFNVLMVQLKHPKYQQNQMNLSLVQQLGQHKLYQYTPSSQENGTEFEDPFDEVVLMRLLTEFDLQNL